LLSAQNSFLAFWVNYEVLRRGLDLDLGTMQLDSEGLWIDPGTIGEDYGQYDPWLWRTGGADCTLPLPDEVMPADLLPNHQRSHTEELPLPGEPTPAPHSGYDLPHLEGLPRVEGRPARPADPAPPPQSLLPPVPLP
jgi:hypothetical protein